MIILIYNTRIVRFWGKAIVRRNPWHGQGSYPFAGTPAIRAKLSAIVSPKADYV